MLPFVSFSQTGTQKHSKDSIKYYQMQLAALQRANYDSLINSDKYKTLLAKLNQNGKSIQDNFGVELCVFTGLQWNKYSNLNERLNELNVREKKQLMLPFGVGLAFRFKKVIVGYDLAPIIIGDYSRGTYIHGYVSTNVIRTKKWIFSPQLGYGGQNVVTRIVTKSSATDFNSYFTTSANQVELNHRNSVIDIAMGFKFVSPQGNGYIPLFRIGYRYATKSKAWEVSNGSSVNAPFDKNSNVYFQIMFGFGD